MKKLRCFYYKFSAVVAVLLFLILVYCFYEMCLDAAHMIQTMMDMYKNKHSDTPYYFDVCLNLSLYCLVLGFSYALPSMRKIYRFFPWMYPLTLTLMLDYFILAVAYSLLNKGYQLTNDFRNYFYFVFMIAEIIINRLLMYKFLKLDMAGIFKYDKSIEKKEKAVEFVPGQNNLKYTKELYVELFLGDKKERPLTYFGVILICASFLFSFLSPDSTWDNSKIAQDALKYGVSSELKAGTMMYSEDSEGIFTKDYEIKNTAQAAKSKLWIWDYNDAKGDYLQLFADGKALGDPFLLLNSPRSFKVPANCKLEVKGVYSQDRIISYAIKFDFNGTSYLDAIKEGGSNVFTLTEPDSTASSLNRTAAAPAVLRE